MRRLLATMAAIALAAGPGWAKPVKTIERKTQTKVCEATFSYPETGETAIDSPIAEWVDGLAADFAGACKEAEANPASTGPAGKYDAALNFTVHRDDAAAFSVSFEYYSYMGGAHPNTLYFGQTYLRPDGRRAYAAELLGQRGIRALSAFAIKDLTRQLASGGMSDADWLKRGAGPAAPNFENFVMKPNGDLEILFSPYQVAAYAAGPQNVTVPARIAKQWLRPDPRAPMASFECARAKSKVEKAICADWRLARADRQMAEDYAQRVDAEYEPSGKQKWVQTQRAWLKTRDGSCARAKDMTDCLLPLIEARRKQINAPQP